MGRFFGEMLLSSYDGFQKNKVFLVPIDISKLFSRLRFSSTNQKHFLMTLIYYILNISAAKISNLMKFLCWIILRCKNHQTPFLLFNKTHKPNFLKNLNIYDNLICNGNNCHAISFVDVFNNHGLKWRFAPVFHSLSSIELNPNTQQLND